MQSGKNKAQESSRVVSRGCIVNLRFEECRFSRKAAHFLAEFLKYKQILETIGFHKISFEDIIDFKKIVEGV